MSEFIRHRDDVEPELQEEGGIRGNWTYLSWEMGARRVALNLIEVPAGARSTPVHSESPQEEMFFVLRGSGLSWQHDGRNEHVYEVGPGDAIVHLAGEEAHSLVAGLDGLDVAVFGEIGDSAVTYFPRIQAVRAGPALIDVDGRHQWKLEAALGDPDLPDPEPRPGTIVNIADAPAETEDRGRFGYTWRRLTPSSRRSGLNMDDLPPGKMNCPLHCHSAEEELFYVLEGDGVCILGDEEHPVRAGHGIWRPPATRVAHGFRAGESGMKVLCYGTRESNDIAYYPTSKKVSFRGVGLMTRVEQLDYWDGE